MTENPRGRRLVTGEGALRELRETLAGEGLALPPVPPDLVQELKRLGRWGYATAPINPNDLYCPHRCLNRVSEFAGKDVLAFSHAGHGINSYSLNYLLQIEHLLLFVQVGWGGAYMDPQERRDHWNRTVIEIEDFLVALESCEQTFQEPAAGFQVVSSHFRNIESVETLEGFGPVPIPEAHGPVEGGKSAIVAATETLRSPCPFEPGGDD